MSRLKAVSLHFSDQLKVFREPISCKISVSAFELQRILILSTISASKKQVKGLQNFRIFFICMFDNYFRLRCRASCGKSRIKNDHLIWMVTTDN